MAVAQESRTAHQWLVHLDDNPLVESAAPIQGQPPVKLQTERFQPMCSARPGERHWLRRMRKIFHEIKVLAAGFKSRTPVDKFNAD
jgi:hypothetical protein